MKKLLFYLILLLNYGSLCAQNFTKEDTLKGSETQFRNFWDVKKYEIIVEPIFTKQFLKGQNRIEFEITKDIENPIFQIDFQNPMVFTKIDSDFKMKSSFERKGDFIFISTQQSFKKGERHFIQIHFEGNPKTAKNAPWDGGWVFAQDNHGNPWMTVAQEGIGAAVWLPLKDSWSDEPDEGMIMHIITPSNLVGVGNGRLKEKKINHDKTTYTWEVKNPINAYSIVPTIGKFVNFKDTFKGEKGNLDLDYWVLDYHLDKAKNHFKVVHPMLRAFEYWMGPYPFYEDSYKLVETPHLGMEHQSNIAYGNNYQNGYMGTDLSQTGIGLKWDFIIIHESGHEWFANSITAKDRADMWIHESFTTYSEVLFVNEFMGKESGDAYAQGIRINIENDKPIVAPYGVNRSGSGDMYFKGANMLHTIRQVVDNDEAFRQLVRGLTQKFYHQVVTSQQIEKYIIEKTGLDLSGVFNQYLRTSEIPKLVYQQEKNKLTFHWENVVSNFILPIRITQGNQTIHLNPTTQSQTIELPNEEIIKTNPNYSIIYENKGK